MCVWHCVCVAIRMFLCVCERDLNWLPNGLVLFQTLHLSLLVTLWLGFVSDNTPAMIVTLWLDFVSDTTPEIFVGYSMAWFCFRHYTWDCWLLYGLVLFQTLHLRCFLLLYGLICFRYYTWDVCWLLYGLVCFRPGTSQWVDSTSMLTGSLTALCVSDSATQSTDIFVSDSATQSEWMAPQRWLAHKQLCLFQIPHHSVSGWQLSDDWFTNSFVCFRLSDAEWVDGTSVLTDSLTSLFVSDSATQSEWMAPQCWLLH